MLRRTVSTSDTLFVGSPVHRNGDALQFVPELMKVGKPYPFQFKEWWFIAVKRADSTLDFFYISE